MSKRMAEVGVEWAQRRLSRRGFVAWLGKFGLAVGAASIGVGSLPGRAKAACLCTPPCGGAFPCPFPMLVPFVCPPGCMGLGSTTCCDDGPGGTGTCHVCHGCNCGYVGTCFCEYDLGYVCSSTPC